MIKLTAYFGERDRVSDALLDLYARRQIRASVLLRGIEGFGAKHHLLTQRLLSLSEDLPLVAIAVDERPAIEAAADEVTALLSDGLVTLERAGPPAGPEAKLTLFCGRHDRVEGRPAFVAIVDLLRSRGAAGATVLLGVDGTLHGERRRAGFLSRNVDVPLMIVSVGDVAGLAPELTRLLPRPLVTLERVTILKRDGLRLAPLPGAPPGMWQKLTLYASEQSRHEGSPLYAALIGRLRDAGAAGATALRGIWGYHGEHAPHGDRVLAVRRRVPVVCTLVDSPDRMREWERIVDELTQETGLVTSEFVPAFKATAGPDVAGTLDLR